MIPVLFMINDDSNALPDDTVSINEGMRFVCFSEIRHSKSYALRNTDTNSIRNGDLYGTAGKFLTTTEIKL